MFLDDTSVGLSNCYRAEQTSDKMMWSDGASVVLNEDVLQVNCRVEEKMKMRMVVLGLLGLLAGCDHVSKADISNAIKMCEGHHGLKEVLSTSENTVDVYCNSGAQFTGIAKIADTSCQDVNGKQYCN